jgi:signal transduction histidine kinase
VLVLNQTRHDLEREAELRAYQVLGTEDIPALERIVDLAAELSGMAIAEINVVSTADVVHVATTNRDHLRVPREYSFCSTVIEHDVENFIVRDARVTEPFSASPYVTGEKAAIRSYASARLRSAAGTVLGTLCVFDSELREVDEVQLRALRSLAGMVMDVLEMRRSARDLAATLGRLADSHRELFVSNESLEAFAGQISHDLQTPLTAVEMALELLADEVTFDEDARMLLDHARAGGRRMARTITDLLDFAVVGEGSPATRVDLDGVVADVLDDLGPGLLDAKIEAGPLPAVLGHESEVRAVLQNLIANAVKFSAPSGVAQVRISGEVNDGTALITVADNGPGVPEEQRQQVFGLAFRGESTVDGHGIGLATCARIISARGGRIGVDQVPSGGAAFWFELPVG